MKRPRVAHRPFALVTALAALGLAGCSALSPSTITETYPAADGTNVDLPGSTVGLRNFLVVGAAKGDRASVVGSVVNDGATQVDVRLQATLGATDQPQATLVTVGPHSSVRIGPDQETVMVLPQLPVVPGAMTALSAATQSGGTTEFNVPVIPPQSEYASLTPGPTTAAPTPTTSTTKTPEASTSESPSPSPSDN